MYRDNSELSSPPMKSPLTQNSDTVKQVWSLMARDKSALCD
jgi:hypothetical protein